MIPDQVSLYNLALNAIGARANLSDTTDTDYSAEVCNLWFPVIRDTVLAGAPWPSCRSVARLALAAEVTSDTWDTTEPEPGYSFVYAAPSDMVAPRHLTTFEPFRLTNFAGAKAILTNTPEAILVYTRRENSIYLWEDSLALAVAYGLAAHICGPLSGKTQKTNMLIQQANALLANAQAEAMNMSMQSYETLPDWIVARGFAGTTDLRYYYPFGSMLAGINVG